MTSVSRLLERQAAYPWWARDARIYRYRLHGDEREFVTIETLAAALKRSPQTIRRWERQGQLPRTPFGKATKRRMGQQQRLYLIEQVEAMVDAAERDGLLCHPSRTPSTAFTASVREVHHKYMR